jgi:hypothetical protein
MLRRDLPTYCGHDRPTPVAGSMTTQAFPQNVSMNLIYEEVFMSRQGRFLLLKPFTGGGPLISIGALLRYRLSRTQHPQECRNYGLTFECHTLNDLMDLPRVSSSCPLLFESFRASDAWCSPRHSSRSMISKSSASIEQGFRFKNSKTRE